MKRRYFLSLVCMLGIMNPVYTAQVPNQDVTVQAPVVTASSQLAQGASDALLTTFPLASSLVNYGWCERGWLSVAKTLGVDISVLVGIIALQQSNLNKAGQSSEQTVDGQPVTKPVVQRPRGFSYYAGCVAGVGVLGALVAYKSWSCDESAFSVLVKAGLRTLISRTTGAILNPILKAAELSPESQQSLELLKQLFLDDYLTYKIQPQILAGYIKPDVV